ncbi:unnamed protein product [Urochloa humidicola]
MKSYLSRSFRNKTAIPIVRDAKRILARSYKNGMTDAQKQTFGMAFAAFCCAYMLGPMDRSAKVLHSIWYYLSNLNEVEQLNWAAYVLSVIKESAKQVQANVMGLPSSIKLGGCWLYLELLYLDTVDLGPYNT